MITATDREALLDDAISLLLHSLDEGTGGIDDGETMHALAHATDGDGWNEPFSLHTTCECGSWDGIEWMQSDREQSDRPTGVELLLAWRAHIGEVLGHTDGIDENEKELAL